MGKSILFLFLILARFSFAGNLEHISPSCANAAKAKISEDQIQVLQEQNLFPRGNDSIAEKLRYCKQSIDQNRELVNFNSKLLAVTNIQRAKQALDVAADLTNKIKILTESDLKKSAEVTEIGKKCSLLLQKKSNSLPQECIRFRDIDVPFLKENLAIMRQLLALITESKKSALMKQPFAASGAKGRKEMAADAAAFSIKPLNPKEWDELMQEFKNPKRFVDYVNDFYSVINQSPILLFFKNDTITNEELYFAFSEIEKINSGLNENSYIHIGKNLDKVILDIPAADRGSYCAVANALLKNQYNQANFLKFMTTVASAPFVIKAFFQGLLMGITSEVLTVSSVSAADSFVDAHKAEKLLTFNLNLCLKTAYTLQSEQKSICDSKSISDFSNVVSNSMLYLPVMGTPKVFKPLQKTPANR